MYGMELTRLNAVVEKAHNRLKLKGYDPSLLDNAINDTSDFQEIIVSLGKKVQSIKSNRRLSTQGQLEEIAQARQQAQESFDVINKAADLQSGLAEIREQLTWKAAQNRQGNRPDNELTDLLQVQEIRRYLAGKDQGEVNELFIEAASNYGKHTEPLYRAIAEPPYPIALVDKEILSQGQATLERAISPDLASLHDLGAQRADLYAVIAHEVQGLIDNPQTIGS